VARTLILMALILPLFACKAAQQARVNEHFNSYIGKPVSDLALILGPPTTQFAAGTGRMAFQWEHYDEAHSPGVAVPVGNTLIYSAPHSQQRECRVSVVAHTSALNPNLGDWIIDNWRYAGSGCI
jgi:hypothetical protein